MNSRKILIIAPDLAANNLPKTNVELAAIKRFHPESKTLSGTVRDQDIAREIVDDDYEIIWFISHGNADGIMLSDGYLLPTAAVVQYVRADSTALCVLNTCDSEDIAFAITSGAGADVICTISAIDNGDAVRLGELLAAELAYTETYREAYELVSPEGSKYRYYQAGMDRSHFRDGDEMLKAIYSLQSDVRLLRWQAWVTVAIVVIESLALAVMWLSNAANFAVLFAEVAKR